MWWGYSPALDILEEYETVSESSSSSEAPATVAGNDGGTLDVLLLGCGDGRHQLRSLARRWRRGERMRNASITWHVAEPTLELTARQLLLQSVAYASCRELGPRERVRLYLELYGNTLLRARTAAFLARRGAQLARCVADEEALRAQLGATLEPMRHRERDYVQDACLLWRTPPANLAMTTLWDQRLRRALGVRYDSRDGVFDWDYHMRLRDLCGDAITSREYQHWRDTGMAFTWFETECSRPNASLLSWVERAHGSLTHRGYCGDIESGPFPAFGVECEDSNLLRSCNGARTHRSVDISERNLMRLFHELRHSEPYVPPKEDRDDTGAVITVLPDARDDWGVDDGGGGGGGGDEGDGGGESRKVPPLSCTPPPRSLTRFLPPDAILKYPKKTRHQNTFDVIVFGQSLAHLLTAEMATLARDGALVLVEGRRYAVSKRKKDVEEYAQTLVQSAKDAGCVPQRPFDSLEQDWAAFRVRRG